VLRQDFALDDDPADAGTSQFAASVGTEMTIESCGTCVVNTRGAQ
jgi:hypothetical protein